ncbi:acyl-homoserine-lactone synthase [Novosphingobium terrae]|uniref:acyl-homoserine-lactone synthase n=1 Tax=Novosphingobium terrae TaxID=2726189 RepID=UPI00198218D9|nr:acyl-homoserine-lactone synthase [Novosphingobium terrae]
MFQRHQSKLEGIREEVLRSMFAARKAVFVDLLKWDVPVLAERYEIDQFDNPDADYIIMSEADGNHLGSARLLKTTGPHILGDLYPQLCEEAPPCGPDILEITRFCLDRRLNATERRQVRDNLVCGLANYALEHGIRSYVAIAERAWGHKILNFGWDCKPLGPPSLADTAGLMALRIEITARTPGLLAANGIVSSALPGENFLAA